MMLALPAPPAGRSAGTSPSASASTAAAYRRAEDTQHFQNEAVTEDLGVVLVYPAAVRRDRGRDAPILIYAETWWRSAPWRLDDGGPRNPLPGCGEPLDITLTYQTIGELNATVAPAETDA